MFWRFGKPPPDSQAALPEAHERLTSPETVAEVPLAGLFSKGDLYLDGLTSLSHEAAMALAQHKGELWLSGLVALSPEAAEALAEHNGKVWLRGLARLPVDAEKALRENRNIVLPEKFRR